MTRSNDTDYDSMKKYIRLMRENYQFNNNDNSNRKKNNLLFGKRTRQPLKEEEKEITDEELEQEKQKMENATSKPIEFDNFKIYSDNVEMSGILIKESIKFTFSLDSVDGIYISSQMLQLSDPVLETIQKLKSYYNEWSNYWAQEIR